MLEPSVVFLALAALGALAALRPVVGMALALATVPWTGTAAYALDAPWLTHALPLALLLPAAVRVAWERRHEKPTPGLRLLLLAGWIFAGLVSAALLLGRGPVSPEDRPLLVGLVGFATIFGCVPAILLAPTLTESHRQSPGLVRLLSASFLLACTLALVQAVLIESGQCPQTPDLKVSADNPCLVGGGYAHNTYYSSTRLPGTAASPWHWSWILIAGATITVVGWFRDDRGRILHAAAALSIVAASYVSGQRVALVLVPVALASFAGAGWLARQRLSLRLLSLSAGAAVALGAIVLGLSSLGALPQSLEIRIGDFGDRWRAASPSTFTRTQLEWVRHERPGLFGEGVGRGTNAARTFGSTRLVEAFPAKRLFETGWIGATLFLMLVLEILRRSARRIRSCSVDAAVDRSQLVVIWLFVFVLAAYPTWYAVDTPPTHAVFWLAVGLLWSAGSRTEDDSAR